MKNLNKLLIISIIIAVLLISGSIFYYYIYYLPQQEKEAEKKEMTEEERLVSMVEEWGPRVTYIECWLENNEDLWWWGSGTTMMDEEGVFVLTSAHIITITDEEMIEAMGKKIDAPIICDVWIGEDIYRVGEDDFFIDPDYSSDPEDFSTVDVGVIYIDEPTHSTEDIAYSPRWSIVCEEEASVGERIIILGYPWTGSEDDITVTEGIISGYEFLYYITSAKIEAGNSGGTAILIKDNCYLGIPAYTIVGDYESMGRILDFNAYLDFWEEF